MNNFIKSLRLDLSDNIDEVDQDDPCNGKGLVFRGYNSTYKTNNNGIEKRQGIRILKRKSCFCRKCSWIWDDINEWLDSIQIDDIEDGKLYEFKTSGSRDFESGHYEIDYIYVEKINEIPNTTQPN